MTPDQKLAGLLWYVENGSPVFPCSEDKNPLTDHGFKDASTSAEQIRKWHETWPHALWGVRTGPRKDGGAGIFVVDIDINHKSGKNGFVTWDALRDQYSEPIETVTARTRTGGQHLFFRFPDGHIIPSKQDALGEGIDVKSTGGYVIVAPSDGWSYELSPRDTPLADPPQWILSRVNGRTKTAS